MNKVDYDNPSRMQILTLSELANQQTETCFHGLTLDKLLSKNDIKGKIILTGCGDSLAAAGVAIGAFDIVSQTDQVEVMDPVQFTRFTSRNQLWFSNERPLVIVISSSGGSPRILEILQKAKHVGAKTLLITNKVKSAATEISDSVFFLDTMDRGNSPGLRSYFASIIGLVAIACKVGLLNGSISNASLGNWTEAIREYAQRYDDVLENIDSEIFILAQKWSKFTKIELVGDYTEWYSALFCMDKFYECNGTLSTCQDSEDWCHVNFFTKNPQQIGTIFFADKYAPGFSRMVDTIAAAQLIGRPVLVVTNAEKGQFVPGVTVCTLPEAPVGYEWLMPCMDFIPASLLTAYCSALENTDFFGGMYDIKKQKFNLNGIIFTAMRQIREQSEIVVCE